MSRYRVNYKLLKKLIKQLPRTPAPGAGNTDEPVNALLALTGGRHNIPPHHRSDAHHNNNEEEEDDDGHDQPHVTDEHNDVATLPGASPSDQITALSR